MAPAVFEREEWEYVVRHLRILSGFYGMLSPTDGVLPYRLEMQARGNFPVYPGINAGGWKEQKTVHTLYEFWMDDIYSRLTEDEENEVEILNLASKEYSKAVEPYLQPADRFVTCIFGYLDADRTENPKVKVKGTEAKMARGEMVRYLAERRIENLEEVKLFSLMGYQFSPEWSDDNQFVFLKRITG